MIYANLCVAFIMSQKPITDPEKAQNALLSKTVQEFEQSLAVSLSNESIEIVLLYFPANGQLNRLIQKNKDSYSESQLKNFKINSQILNTLKQEISNESLEKVKNKYNEAIILSALVQLVRDNEANILTYTEYLRLKEKFLNWPKIGIKNEKILLAWKDFSNAIKELEEWMTEKKESYMPYLEKIINLNEIEKESDEVKIFNLLQDIPEKETFYIICNILLTNPILRKDFLSVSLLSGPKLLAFEKVLFKLLDVLNEKTNDKSLKGLIYLFKIQIKDQRKELS